MAPRYVVGPLPSSVARSWEAARGLSQCRAFNFNGDLDFKVKLTESWEKIRRGLPDAWEPRLWCLYLSYATVPPAIWSSSEPLIGLAPDWNLQWHYYRRVLPRCDWVLSDQPGVTVMRQAGMTHARPANLFGIAPELIRQPSVEDKRDIDVLFVGNLHPVVQGERLAWLARLARLKERWNVHIATGVFGAAYSDLLSRARIVFNRSIRGECNMRVFEAVAAGALLFQEEDNQETFQYFRPGQECVAYNATNLETQVDYYLKHEEERQALASAAHARLPDFAFERLFDQALEGLEPLTESRRKRPPFDPIEDVLTRTWQLCSSTQGDPSLAGDLVAAIQAPKADLAPERLASLHNALGLVVALTDRGNGGWTAPVIEQAACHFQGALECDPNHILAGLNLVEALAIVNRTALAREGALRLLNALDRGHRATAEMLDCGHFPTGFDQFRVEWEKAAWAHADSPERESDAKHTLLRARLHTLLAELTGDLGHYAQAAQLRPDLPVSQAAWGCALGRAGRSAEAVAPLRSAVAANPFDTPAARALCQALLDSGDLAGQRELARERRLLAAAAPQLVSLEPWFAAQPSANGDAPKRPHTASPKHLHTISPEDFRRRFGTLDTRRAIGVFTGPVDTGIVLTLLVQSHAKRILEIGTAAGHMTANLTEWANEDALIYSLGTVADLYPASGPQASENPPRASFGCHANHFGKASRVFLITADSLTFDFSRLGPLDFVFIDGAHDLEHVLSDTLKAYRQLAPGGCLAWHDVQSSVPWVQVDAALAQAGLPEPIYHVAGSGVGFLHKQAPAMGESHSQQAPAAVIWEGAQAALHSLALVNREVCSRLLKRGHEVSLVPREDPAEAGTPTVTLPEALRERLHGSVSRPADVHVRHAWPPDFKPPDRGHWVMIQPWEFGSLPKAWVGPLTNQIDEVWAYTRYVRECYIQSGVPADRVRLIPLGVDTELFTSEGPTLPLQTAKSFKFLFVGGTIFRKGFDILLEAYGKAFTAQDDVCLVVKEMGARSFYRGQTAEAALETFRERANAPEVELLDRELTAEELAGLYRACDCLVHPYRGEGFGLPIAEAMATGLPVIVTGMGAALDYCNGDRGYLVLARMVNLPNKRLGDLETVNQPWLAEPDRNELVNLIRYVHEHPEEARAKGKTGQAFVRQSLTWDHTVFAIERRLEALRQQPIRRQTPKSASSIGMAPVAGRRARVSLCLIVKNEEANLPACLGSAADLVDETIIVDTGSTDNTRAVAERYGARVVEFPWVDSFAAARNEGLRHATGDWIFWMDADDRLDEDNRHKLRELFANLQNENVAYSMKCLCLPDPIDRTATLVDHMRLFRNQPELRWKYRVHEQILPAIRSVGGQVRFADVVIQHAGYQDPSLRRRKLERDLRLLDLEDREHPNDAFTLFNLGTIYQELGKPADALPVLKQSLQLSHPADSIVRKLYALIVGCYRALGLVAEALTMCQEGRCLYPEDTELLFVEGLLRLHQQDLAGAEACLIRVQEPSANNHFASVDAGLRTYKAWHNLGVVYQKQGRLAEAAGQWERVLSERPDFLQAWLGLSELYCQQGAWADLEKLAQRMEQEHPQGVAEGALMRARGLLARQDYPGARSFLEALMDKDPEALMPRILYSHAWLKEGKDPLSAEYALRTILARDPGNREARHNLTLLLQSHGRKLEGPGVDGVTLADLYQAVCTKPSNITEHLPALYALAEECQHITEFGTRTAESTTAFLYAQPKKLICYDLRQYAEFTPLEILAGRTRLTFHLANVLRVSIEETDLLFVNSWHTYEQLKEELRLHGTKARKYIVIHDTTTMGANGEFEGRRGLEPAIEEFLAEGHFVIKGRYEQNSGLTILVRQPVAQPESVLEAVL
jgi:glycosyltransferase involved in cell wall biosynthesis/tetratricopeptide (TPR) repeat protein/predicted O-methyltransferase YrrM